MSVVRDKHPVDVVRPPSSIWGHACPWSALRGLRHNEKTSTVVPGAKLLLRQHERQAEFWVTLDGSFQITTGAWDCAVQRDDEVCVPGRAAHYLANPHREPVRVLEIDFDEDGIARLGDGYACA